MVKELSEANDQHEQKEKEGNDFPSDLNDLGQQLSQMGDDSEVKEKLDEAEHQEKAIKRRSAHGIFFAFRANNENWECISENDIDDVREIGRVEKVEANQRGLYLPVDLDEL